MTMRTFFRSAVTIALLAAVLSATGTLAASSATAGSMQAHKNKVPMAVLWSGVAGDDEKNSSYEYQSGLGIWVGCFLEIINKRHRNRLDIQFSYTQLKPRRLKIVADVRKGMTGDPQPHITKTLDSTNLKQWDYIRYIPSCDDTYFVYVGFPK